jgi:hypothetical protein
MQKNNEKKKSYKTKQKIIYRDVYDTNNIIFFFSLNKKKNIMLTIHSQCDAIVKVKHIKHHQVFFQNLVSVFL